VRDAADTIDLPPRLTYQLVPYTASNNFPQHRIFWNEQQRIPMRGFERPIRIGFVFQGVGAGEKSASHIAIRKATQLNETRFKLPMLHCFVRV